MDSGVGDIAVQPDPFPLLSSNTAQNGEIIYSLSPKQRHESR